MWFMQLAKQDDLAEAKPAPADNADPPQDDDHPSVAEEVGVVLNISLPWAISLLLHLGLALLAVFIGFVTIVDNEEETVVPKTELLRDPTSEVLTQATDVEVAATSTVPQEVQTQEAAESESPSPSLNEQSQDSLIAVAGEKALPAGGGAAGDGDVGVGMYGLSGSANSVVYVVDASGSLIDSLPFVVNELKSSIRKLQSSQTFNIIFFQDGEAVELPPRRRMKRATPDAKRDAANWITLENGNISPGGSSTPVEAIRLAISYKPDLVYILSDNITGSGQYAIDQTQLLDLIEQLKQRSRAANTRINTIQFLHPDPLGTLKKIAEQSGGRYRFVRESAVGSR